MAIGIDIGSEMTRVSCVERKGKGFEITGYARLPTREVVEQPGRLAEALSAAGASRGSAAVSASGRDVILKISNYPMVPEWRLRLLIEYEVGELSDRAGGDILSAYRILDIPGRARSEYTALLALAKEPYLERRIALLEGAGLKLDAAVPAPVATGNAIAIGATDVLAPGEHRTVMVVDVGAETTDVSLIHFAAPDPLGTLIFARNANFGGSAFVQSVAETFGIKPMTAAKMIAEEGALPGGGVPEAGSSGRSAKLRRALEETASDLAGLLRSSTKFSQAQLRATDLDIDEIVLTGGVARLAGLDVYLGNALRIPVRKAEFTSLAAEGLPSASLAALRDDGPAAATAVGLGATSAAGDRLVSVRLLPLRLERRRRFLHQQLFVLLAAGIAFFSAILLWATVANNRDVEQARASVLRKEADELRTLRANLEDAIAERADLTETRGSWATVVEPARAVSEAMAALRRTTPRDAYLTQVALEPRQLYTKNPVVRVEGKIRESTKSVSRIYEDFAASLEAMPGFEFKTSNLKHDDDGSGLTFSFRLEWTGETPAIEEEDG